MSFVACALGGHSGGGIGSSSTLSPVCPHLRSGVIGRSSRPAGREQTPTRGSGRAPDPTTAHARQRPARDVAGVSSDLAANQPRRPILRHRRQPFALRSRDPASPTQALTGHVTPGPSIGLLDEARSRFHLLVKRAQRFRPLRILDSHTPAVCTHIWSSDRRERS